MIFPLLEIIGKKKFNYNEKRKKIDWCRNLEISYCMKLYCGEQWQRQGTGLGVLGAGLGVQARRQQAWQRALGRTGRAAGAGVGRRGRRRACRVLGAGARGWRADGRGRARTGVGVRRRARTGASVRGRARTGAGARRACMRRQARERTSERSERGPRQAGSARQGARGRAAGRHTGHGRLGGLGAAWAPGLALGSALGPFSIRFDSFFFPESSNEHCSL